MTDIVECLAKFNGKWPYEQARLEIVSLRQQLADTEALRVCANEDANQLAHEANVLAKLLAECQAREVVLRDGLLDIDDWDSATLSASGMARLLDLPSDSTALDTMKKQWQREALLEAADHIDGWWLDKSIRDELRRMAKELE